jgi:hypothetical protein
VLPLAVETGDVLPSRRMPFKPFAVNAVCHQRCVPSKRVLDLAIKVGVTLEAAVGLEVVGCSGCGGKQGLEAVVRSGLWRW